MLRGNVGAFSESAYDAEDQPIPQRYGGNATNEFIAKYQRPNRRCDLRL
jgi:hypothetical protein